jgi:hypothetical protein
MIMTWITVTGNSKTKILLNPKPNPKVHNAFAILSQHTPTQMRSSQQQIDNNKTIIPRGPREHRRQRKIAPGAFLRPDVHPVPRPRWMKATPPTWLLLNPRMFFGPC